MIASCTTHLARKRSSFGAHFPLVFAFGSERGHMALPGGLDRWLWASDLAVRREERHPREGSNQFQHRPALSSFLRPFPTADKSPSTQLTKLNTTLLTQLRPLPRSFTSSPAPHAPLVPCRRNDALPDCHLGPRARLHGPGLRLRRQQPVSLLHKAAHRVCPTPGAGGMSGTGSRSCRLGG